MTSTRELSEGDIRIFKINPDIIDVEPGLNPRIDFGDIETLGKSIIAAARGGEIGEGIRNPLQIMRNGDRFTLDDGERRSRAVTWIKEKGHKVSWIPCKVVSTSRSRGERLLDTILTNEGKPLIPLEEARAYQMLRDEGNSIKAIADALGKSESTIADRLKLINADEEVLDALAKGKVGVTVVVEAIKTAKGDQSKVKELVREHTHGDKAKAKRRTTTDAKGRFYMTKAHRSHLMAAYMEAKKYDWENPEHARHIGRLEGICQILGIDKHGLDSHEINLASFTQVKITLEQLLEPT